MLKLNLSYEHAISSYLKHLFVVNNKKYPFYSVVYTMHEMIEKREYDELVKAMVKCQRISTTFLKYPTKKER